MISNHRKIIHISSNQKRFIPQIFQYQIQVQFLTNTVSVSPRCSSTMNVSCWSWIYGLLESWWKWDLLNWFNDCIYNPPRIQRILIIVTFQVIPCILLLFLTYCLLIKLAKNKKKRVALLRERANDGAYKDRTTFMLLLMVSIFLCTELPQGIIAIFNGLLHLKIVFKLKTFLYE